MGGTNLVDRDLIFDFKYFSFMDLKIEDDAGIPVEPFLDSCKSLLPIFGKKPP